MSYLGSKAQAGVFQRIICNLPPHSVYIEPFFGTGKIFWTKRPADLSVVIDADAGLLGTFGVDCRRHTSEVTLPPDSGNPGAKVCAICGDALPELAALETTLLQSPDTVIYCDPPYLLSTRTSRHRYKHEFGAEDQHAALLALLDRLPCKVLLSGYPSRLYSEKLIKPCWRCISYRIRTRGRTLTECLWCNFPEPAELHDWRFFGDNYRQRLNMKRLAARFTAKLDRMPVLRRNFILHLVHQRQG